MSARLKNCPFCGSDKVFFHDANNPVDIEGFAGPPAGFIWCHKCNFTSDTFTNEDIAAQFCNRRDETLEQCAELAAAKR